VEGEVSREAPVIDGGNGINRKGGAKYNLPQRATPNSKADLEEIPGPHCPDVPTYKTNALVE